MECDRDSAVLSHLADDESCYFDRTIEGVEYAGFHATSESVPRHGNCFDKLSQSSRKSRTGGIGDSRTAKHDRIHDAYKSSVSLNGEEKSGARLSCQESEFESDEFVDNDTASEKSQTQLQDENHRRTDETRYASDRDRSAGCPDGRSRLCPTDRDEDDQTYMNRNTLDARNLRELEVNRHSRDTLDSSSEHLRMVGEENVMQRSSVAENRRNVKEEKVFGRANGETEPIFNTAYGRKSAVEDRFSSVKVKPRSERRSCACAPETGEQYASNITVRQNRFSSASVIEPLRTDHSVRPYAVSSSLGIAFAAGSGASVSRRTLPDRTVTCKTTPASSSANPSTDSFARRTANSSDHQNLTVASGSAAFLRSKKAEHCNECRGENYGSAGEYHDPVRKPQNTSRKIVHMNFCRDEEDAASRNFSNNNHNQFDVSPDVTGGSDLYQNPFRDGVQTDCFSSAHDDPQLFLGNVIFILFLSDQEKTVSVCDHRVPTSTSAVFNHDLNRSFVVLFVVP